MTDRRMAGHRSSRAMARKTRVGIAQNLVKVGVALVLPGKPAGWRATAAAAAQQIESPVVIPAPSQGSSRGWAKLEMSSRGASGRSWVTSSASTSAERHAQHQPARLPRGMLGQAGVKARQRLGGRAGGSHSIYVRRRAAGGAELNIPFIPRPGMR
jgi:hypothetical protein